MNVALSVVLPFFIILMIMYVIQWYAAFLLSQQRRSVKGIDNIEFTIKIWVAALRINGGPRNIWGLFVLVVFVPIIFASLSEVVKLFDGHNTSILPFFRVFCMSTIVVLITLEFAYIYNFREKIGEWTTMLLAALVLDLATLMLFIFTMDASMFDQNLPKAPLLLDPLTGEAILTESVESREVGASSRITLMVILTVIAFLATFSILVFARTEAVLHDGKVDFSYRKSNEDSQGQNDSDQLSREPKDEIAKGKMSDGSAQNGDKSGNE